MVSSPLDKPRQDQLERTNDVVGTSKPKKSNTAEGPSIAGRIPFKTTVAKPRTDVTQPLKKDVERMTHARSPVADGVDRTYRREIRGEAIESGSIAFSFSKFLDRIIENPNEYNVKFYVGDQEFSIQDLIKTGKQSDIYCLHDADTNKTYCKKSLTDTQQSKMAELKEQGSEVVEVDDAEWEECMNKLKQFLDRGKHKEENHTHSRATVDIDTQETKKATEQVQTQTRSTIRAPIMQKSRDRNPETQDTAANEKKEMLKSEEEFAARKREKTKWKEERQENVQKEVIKDDKFKLDR